MKTFYRWIQESFDTYRGGKNKDWVSEDDYDYRTPIGGGMYTKNPHRFAGYIARSKGKDRKANPYHPTTKHHDDWHQGWDDHHFVHNPENHPYGAAEE